MRVGYRIVERFSPWHDSWASYAKGSGLSHLTEVVGLDCSLCPPVQKEYSGQDDGHLVFEEYISACFRDLEYALSRTQGVFDARYHQVLALAREPTEEDVVTTNLPGCRFKGYELIEDEGGSKHPLGCRPVGPRRPGADTSRIRTRNER